MAGIIKTHGLIKEMEKKKATLTTCCVCNFLFAFSAPHLFISVSFFLLLFYIFQFVFFFCVFAFQSVLVNTHDAVFELKTNWSFDLDWELGKKEIVSL